MRSKRKGITSPIWRTLLPRARTVRTGAWYDSKACFYIFNFTFKNVILCLLTVGRIDKHFHVPNGSEIRQSVGTSRGFGRKWSADEIVFRNSNPTAPNALRTQLWVLICVADGLLGIITSLPPVTSLHKQAKDQTIISNGTVQSRIYLSRLIEIAGKIQNLDDMNTAYGSSTDLYTPSLELIRELKSLASQTPEHWWLRDPGHVKPENIVQFIHYYLVMRAHLPFIMRQASGEEFLYGLCTCMDACESVVQRYQELRGALPPGFFLAGMLDLQAFTATVILLLTSHSTSHSSPSTTRFKLRIDKPKIESEMRKVIKLMRERSNGTCGSRLAQDNVTTLCSLIELLQENDNSDQEHQLTLRVPLLGKLHVRRKPQPGELRLFQGSSEQGINKPNEQLAPAALGTDASMGTALAVEEDLQWDNLSWCIENIHENFLQDFMAEDFD
ncbi:uncharacterized protein N7498_008344 [Penicillium cinerascens]|uniref:Transcription factor domain-containing protein n=1 Tax=Penicillium cinerascens TaxID=70096 RepID=A0A9W9M9L3_9EURO|nr:uncharacterized protein N7498_008344 [Penicillium cinerascens]KAJ5194906.1 hypothetical protein N7498_008344 [Penicillium cinerascens]